MKPAERSKRILTLIGIGFIALIVGVVHLFQSHKAAMNETAPVATNVSPPNLNSSPHEEEETNAPEEPEKNKEPQPVQSVPPKPPAIDADTIKKLLSQLTDIIMFQNNLIAQTQEAEQKLSASLLMKNGKLLPGLEEQQSAALTRTNDFIQQCLKNQGQVAALGKAAKSMGIMVKPITDIDFELKAGHLEHSQGWLDDVYKELLDLLEWLDMEEERILPLTPNPSAPIHGDLDVFERRRLRAIPQLPPDKRKIFDLLDDAWKNAELIYRKERDIRQAIILSTNPNPNLDNQNKIILSEISLKQSDLAKQTHSISEQLKKMEIETAAGEMDKAAKLLWDLKADEAIKEQEGAIQNLKSTLKTLCTNLTTP